MSKEKKTLFDLTEEGREILNRLQNLDAGNEEEEKILDSLINEHVAWEYESSKKLDGYGKIIDTLLEEAGELKGLEEFYKDRLDKIRTRRKAKENHVQRLKNKVLKFMALLGIKKIEGLYRFSRRSTGRSTYRLLVPVEDLPEIAKEYKPIANMDYLRQAADEDPHSVSDWVEKQEPTEYIVIS